MSFSYRCPTLAAAILSVLTLTTQAQAAPDAGALSQQAEQDYKKQGLVIKIKPPKGKGLADKPVEPAAKTTTKTSEPATTQPAEAVAATPPKPLVASVKSFAFTGNTKLTTAQLSKVVASYLSRPIDFAELQKAATAVANAYREAGWIVRTALPPQDIVDGKITIQIIEAVFGNVIKPKAHPSIPTH